MKYRCLYFKSIFLEMVFFEFGPFTIKGPSWGSEVKLTCDTKMCVSGLDNLPLLPLPPNNRLELDHRSTAHGPWDQITFRWTNHLLWKVKLYVILKKINFPKISEQAPLINYYLSNQYFIHVPVHHSYPFVIPELLYFFISIIELNLFFLAFS